MYVERKVKASVIKLLGPRAAQSLQLVAIGEQEPLLFFDDTYELHAFNTVSQDAVGKLPHSSMQVKCVLAAETKLFVGLSTGEIAMYDPYTLELLDKAATSRQAVPMAMTLQSAGTLLAGMQNSTIEVFSFQQSRLLPANHLNNEIKVPYAGEIYRVASSGDEIYLATFSGLFVGKLEVAAQGRPYQVWKQRTIFLQEKMVSQML